MKREQWSIGNCFGYAIRILNSIFCRDPKSTDNSEIEYDEDAKWLVAEQINYLCSDMMIEDAQEILKMVQVIPTGRLCEITECIYHHPRKILNPDLGINEEDETIDIKCNKEKCENCIHNQNIEVKSNLIDHCECL